MSKERLEEIKQYYSRMESMPWDTQEDIRFLIEQAERVQELENVNRVLKKANEGSERDKERLREQIDELEQELHFCQVTKLSMDSVEKYTDDLKKQNKRYKKALELIKLKTLDIKGNKDTRPFQIYGIASEALEVENE